MPTRIRSLSDPRNPPQSPENIADLIEFIQDEIVQMTIKAENHRGFEKRREALEIEIQAEGMSKALNIVRAYQAGIRGRR